MQYHGRVLIVDDEAELMRALSEMILEQGYETAGFTSGNEALEALKGLDFDLLLTDLMMPGMDGITLLRAALEIDPYLVGILMTGQGSVQTAVNAMKGGAFDYILKPFKLTSLMPVLARAMELRRLRLENVQLRETLAIHELSKAVAYTLDVESLLGKTAEAALQQCTADEVSIMLPTPDGKELIVHTVRGAGRWEIVGKRLPVDEGIAGWVARNREPVLLQGKVEDPRFAPVRPRPDIHSSISMPMVVGGQLVGVLNVNVTGARRPLTLGQVKALTILVGTAASVLESAQLYRQVLEAEQKYRSIFENAAEGIFQSCPSGRIITANPAMARMLGYESPEQLLSAISDVNTHLYVDPQRRAEIQRLLQERDSVSGVESQVYRADGSTIWISEHCRTVRGEDGAVLFYEGTIEDITARKRAEEDLAKTVDRMRQAMEGAVDAMAVASELRDPYTAGHQRTVSKLAQAIALEMGLPEEQIEGIRLAAVIHDIGKIGVPAEILSKPGRLSRTEHDLIKAHALAGHEILRGIEFPWPIADVIVQHHERMDGTGYPSGLSGEDICLGARIVAVADVVEAMASHRPYRPALGLEPALEEIRSGRGTRYDPAVVDACVRVLSSGRFSFD